MAVIIKIIKALRFGEALLMTGFLMIGSVFAIYNAQQFSISTLLLISIVSYLLVLSIYATNSFLGYKDDIENPRLKGAALFSKEFYFTMAFLFYALSFIICILINPHALLLHAFIFFMWFIYGKPGFGKHLPVIGTVLHFFVAIAQFNFTFMFFYPVSIESVLMSVYFALLISAGHLHHEAIDFETDMKNNIKTSAVKWGIGPVKNFSFIIFACAHLFWFLLYYFQVIIKLHFIAFFIGFILHLFLFFIYRKQFESKTHYRLRYRFLYRTIYLLCGLFMILHVFC